MVPGTEKALNIFYINEWNVENLKDSVLEWIRV